MKGKTHSTEEIIRILRQADGGETAQAICREHNISEQTFYLPLEKEIRRYGFSRCQTAEGVRKRKRRVKENARRVDVGKPGAQRG